MGNFTVTINSSTTNVPHNIEMSQLICIANQLAGFFMMGNIGYLWVNHKYLGTKRCFLKTSKQWNSRREFFKKFWEAASRVVQLKKKHLYQGLYFNEFLGLRLQLYRKKDSGTWVFLRIWRIF